MSEATTIKKYQKTPDEIKAKMCRWLLQMPAETLARKTLDNVLAEAIEEFKFPIAKSTMESIVKSLDLKLKNRRTPQRNGKAEYNSFGNARRVMFLAREVRRLHRSLGAEVSPLLNKLCDGLNVDEVEPNPT